MIPAESTILFCRTAVKTKYYDFPTELCAKSVMHVVSRFCACWRKSGHLCVNNDDLYVHLYSKKSNCSTPTSASIFKNIGVAEKDYLIEIKFNEFNKFHNGNKSSSGKTY
jgi:hypothetical protein